jgi:DNA-binding CsgD family transcriptional regulator
VRGALPILLVGDQPSSKAVMAVPRDARAGDREHVIAELCRGGLDPDALRAAVLPRLGRAVGFDAAFWATTDPATMLFTSGTQVELPEESAPRFVANELFGDDCNKFTEVARARSGVRTLAGATRGRLGRSARFREILEPIGLGDELRAALRVRGACWGVVCLHRELDAPPFSAAEVELLRRLSPHLGEAIRASLLRTEALEAEAVDGPGVVMLAPDLTVVGTTPAGGRWLEELGPAPPGLPAPTAVCAVAASLRAAETPGGSGMPVPSARVRTRAGRWVVLHASWLSLEGEPEHRTIAMVVEQARPLEVAPLLMAAYGLTGQEREITGMVARGLATREIAGSLFIAETTVQDHLKSIFDKTGARSRRELVATLLGEYGRARAQG